MSKEIKTITGRYEDYKGDYPESYLSITEFWGGKQMIQITIMSDKIAYVQLTKEQVKELEETLNNI